MCVWKARQAGNRATTGAVTESRLLFVIIRGSFLNAKETKAIPELRERKRINKAGTSDIEPTFITLQWQFLTG